MYLNDQYKIEIVCPDHSTTVKILIIANRYDKMSWENKCQVYNPAKVASIVMNAFYTRLYTLFLKLCILYTEITPFSGYLLH
jgi:hypothetical protein